MKTANAPLFKDPIHNGAADPVVIYNEETGTHYMFYTARRADVEEEGVMWVHGTDIGIAESKDNGNSWEYIGICRGLEYGEGKNTYWAPEVIRFGELYHMYVSYVPGIPADWNHPRYILHYTSKNLIDWNFESKLNLSSEKIIDACVFRLPDGIFRMWYKDERNGSHTYFADSKDLYNWEVKDCAADDVPHEGANVFEFGGKYWLITDCWSGLDVYYSDDLTTWTKQSGRILDVGGTREDDGVIANHADVYVTDNNAYIFYFTHPDRQKNMLENNIGNVGKALYTDKVFHCLDWVMIFAPASRYSVCIFSIKAAFVRFKSSGISPAPIPFFCSIEPIPPSKNSILLPSNSLTFIIYILS